MRGGRVLGGVAVAVLLAACASDDDGDGGSTAPSTATAAVAATTSPTSTAVATASEPTAVATVPAGTAGDEIRPEGFDRVQATITLADGSPCELCVWLADDGDTRSRGLMFVTDLGAADAMAFTFETATTARFWMGNTPLPLSIAFFAGDGSFVSTADMEPCLAADDSCQRYGADAEYVTAIEFPRGDVARLGIGAGSVLDLSDLPCA